MKVILFGSVPLATWVLKQVLEVPGLEVLGAVCNNAQAQEYQHHGLDDVSVNAFIKEHNIPKLTLADVLDNVSPNDDYIGISVRFNRLLKEDLLAKFRHGVFNLHGGELPRFRGTNIANHVILEKATRGAGTIHFIDQGVDTGDVVERVFFDVTENDTAEIVFNNTIIALKQAFINILPSLPSGDLKRIPQSDLIMRGEIAKSYKSHELESLKILPADASLEEIDRIARAFTFKTHEPAHFLYNEKKIYVSSRWEWLRQD